MKFHLLLLSTVIAWTLPSPASAADGVDALFPDPVLARGKGFEIRRSELDEITMGFRATRAGQGVRIPQEVMPEVEQDMLQRLIQLRLLNLRATDKEKEAGTELGTKRFEDHKKTFVSEDVFRSKLRSLGSTPEQLKARLIEEAIGELVLNRELRTQVTVTDEDVKKFYADNPGLFEQPEKARVMHILQTARGPSGLALPVAEQQAKREKLEDVLKKARAGEDFASLVKLYTEDPMVKENNGEVTLTREGKYLEFEAAAFSLGPGQVSDIVTTPFGYHIVKLIEKTPAKMTALDEVAKNVKQKIEDDRVKKLMPDYFEKLKKEANVEILIKPGGETSSARGAASK